MAKTAGCSQQTVSLVERGRFEEAGLRAVRGVASALSISLPFDPRLPAGDPARLADARHLDVIRQTVPVLEAAGWTVRLEFSFSHYGERGAVDILAWHPLRFALLIVEVKSELRDAQEVLRVIDVRDRVLRQIAPGEFGHKPTSVASILVVADESTNRRAVAANAIVFDRALASRTVAVKRWIHRPEGDIRGIWFFAVTPERRPDRNDGGVGRVRRGN